MTRASTVITLLSFSYNLYKDVGDNNMPAADSINYMKYITLALLLLVFLYGIKHNYSVNGAMMVSHLSDKELPIYSVETNEPLLALTFDSAWGTEDLDDILAILKKHHAKAVFFVTGDFARKNPDAIRAINEDGHELGNHGDNHKHLPALSKEEIASEITGCHNAVYDITGIDMKLFRAPYSDWNETVVDVAHMMGYSAINQSVDSLDWKDYGVDSIVKQVCQNKNLTNGSIILLHNGTIYTKDALDIMLTNLENMGYRFVPLSDLIYTSDYYLDHTGRQFSKDK